MRFTIATLLFMLCVQLTAQIRVVNKKLIGIEGVHVVQDSSIITISDGDGQITFDTSVLNHTRVFLYHESYNSTEITKEKLEANSVIILTHKTENIKAIVVTPPRQNRQLENIALKMDVIDSKTISLFQPSTSADLLNLGNKVYIQKSQQGGGSPMIRGFATNRILLVVDGVRMNTAIFRSGNVQNVIAIDPFSIEKTDIIFGPSSQFYGSDAIGGVLSFRTKNLQFGKKDTFLLKGNLNLRGNSASRERTWHADFNVGGEKLASLSSITVSRFGDLRMGSNGPDEYLRPFYTLRGETEDSVIQNDNPQIQRFSNYFQVNLMQKLAFKITDSSSITYNLQASTTSNIPRYDRLILTDINGLPVNANWYYGPQKWMLNQLSYQNDHVHKFSDETTISAAYQKFEESRNDRKFNSELIRERVEQVDAFSFNADFSKGLKSTLEMSYGVEWVLNNVSSTASVLDIDSLARTATSTRYPDGSNWQSAGVYINFLKKWNTWFKSEAGIRYNWVKTTGSFDTQFYPFPDEDFSNQNSAVTGSISQLFKLKKGAIGLIASSAFRSPNIDDISKVFDSSPGQVILPNAQLKPEFAYNGEINFDYEFTKAIKLNLVGFYTYLDQAITTTSSTFNGADSIIYDGVMSKVQTLANQDFATIQGIQASFLYKFDSCWNLKSSYTLLRSSSSTNEPIRHITPNFGGTSLNYSNEKFTFSIYSIYNARFDFENFAINEVNDAFLYVKDENGNPYTPAWFTLNVKASYPIRPQITLVGGIENILDKRYRPYGSGITAPGINFMLSLNARI